jgi:hypothetical protein
MVSTPFVPLWANGALDGQGVEDGVWPGSPDRIRCRFCVATQPRWRRQCSSERSRLGVETRATPPEFVGGHAPAMLQAGWRGFRSLHLRRLAAVRGRWPPAARPGECRTPPHVWSGSRTRFETRSHEDSGIGMEQSVPFPTFYGETTGMPDHRSRGVNRSSTPLPGIVDGYSWSGAPMTRSGI